MAADEDKTKGGATAGAPRQRPPVTIDLTAEEVSARAAEAGTVTSPPPEAAKPQASPKADAVKDAAPERPATGRAEAGRADTGRSEGGMSGAAFRGAAARALSRDDGWRQSVLAGAGGGVVALVVVMLLQAVSLIPAPGRSAANQAIEEAKTAADTAVALDRRLTAVEAMVEGMTAIRADIKNLTDRVTALDAIRPMTASRGDLEALAGTVAALGKRLDGAAPAATSADLDALAERIGRLEVSAAAGSGDSAGSAAVASLSAQLADSAAQVKALGERVAAAEGRVASVAATGDGAATRALAVASLRRASEGSAPFAADVDMVAGLGLAGGDLTALRAIAAKGVADRAVLAGEFPAVANAILSATAASDPNAGFFRRLLDGMGSLVTIRPAGPVAGSDPPAIVSRMTDDVARGDLAAALAERDGLPQAGKDASAEWAAKAADRVGLDVLVERIAQSLAPAGAG